MKDDRKHTAKEPLLVIKVGGHTIDDENRLASFLNAFAAINKKKILVHGGGSLATRIAQQMGIPQQLLEGRRITDAETLKMVTMVYAGYINKHLVTLLQAEGCNALGLCGADGNLIQAHRRIHPTIDYGYAGDIDSVDAALFSALLNLDISVVVAPITHDGKGQLLNTNADTIAQEIARSLSAIYEIHLVYSFEKSGVLLDVNDETTVIPVIRPAYYEELKAENKIFSGMIPKIDNAFAALNRGVRRVTIGKAEQLEQIISHSAGTTITNE